MGMEYEAAWDGWRNPIIERYKRQVIAEVTALNRRYHSEGCYGDRGQAAHDALAEALLGRIVDADVDDVAMT